MYHQPSSLMEKYGNVTTSTKVRPKSSPGLRGATERDSSHLQQPSYQERRQLRHGNKKLSRPSTAYLPRESTTFLRSKTVWQETMTPSAIKKCQRPNESQGKIKTTSAGKPPAEQAPLRPHTAVKIQQRLRQLATKKKRSKSACPTPRSPSGYDEYESLYYEDELLAHEGVTPKTSPRHDRGSKGYEDLAHSGQLGQSSDTIKNANNQQQQIRKTSIDFQQPDVVKVGWNSLEVSSSLSTSGNNNNLEHSVTKVTKEEESDVITTEESGLPSSKPSDSSSPHIHISETQSIVAASMTTDYHHRKPNSVVSLPIAEDPSAAAAYTQTVPELRLGNSSVSVALTSAVNIRKLNRRNGRSSVYLQTATQKRTGESAYDRFRRFCKTIRVIAGICLALKSYVKEGKTKQWSLVEMQLNMKADMEKTLSFDPLMFTNLHVSRGSHKLKIILSKLPRTRTPREIEVVLALLRKNKTFANFHRDTQAKLARVMEYQRFEARRIVLKEGHTPSCYYIILSGVCLVNQLDFDKRNNSQFVTTVKEIGSGDSFGEVALLTDTDRECSIICKEEVELVLVNKDDFMSIIRIPMDNERKDLIQYCVEQTIFTNEMYDNIKSNYKTILRQYYKPGTIISKDLNASEYIYVIKLGNVRVLSEVREFPKDKRTKYAMGDDTWKKHAAIKRSMSLIEGSKSRRAGWSSMARKQLYDKTSTTSVPNTGASPVYRRSDSVSNDFNNVPAREFLEAHIALQKETKVADKKAVARAWKRVTVAASSASEKQRQQMEQVELKFASPQGRRVKITYAKVADLTTGGVCGMETLLDTLRPDTRMCIVSDGADCILVSKKIFNSIKNTTKTVEIANRMGTEYPQCSDQVQKIQQARKWTAYKNEIVDDVIYKKDASRGIVM